MNGKYLNLSRSQLISAWSKTRYNHYSDKRKQQFHDSLEKLYNVLLTIDFSAPSYSIDDLRFFRNVLEFFKNSVNLLDNNTISSVPHEIIESLNVAARQWLTDFDDYIIVIENGAYAIKPLVENRRVFYNSIKTKLGVEFKYILLTVSMPRQLTRDYLTNVCLFHELGHFIDTKLKISEELIKEVFYNWQAGKDREVEIWLKTGVSPFVEDTTSGTPGTYIDSGETQYFIMEYFADLFGCQYVGKNYLYFLEYIEVDPSKDTRNHPSYDKRKAMYEDFCNGSTSNLILQLICDKTKTLTRQELKNRVVALSKTEFLNLVPTTTKNENEMLSIFSLGWDVYMNGAKDIEKVNNLSISLTSDKVYDIVNNLIEKSISNYFIKKDWEEAKIVV